MAAPSDNKHCFGKSIKAALADNYLQHALDTYPRQRTDYAIATLQELPNLQQARQQARRIKDYSIAHLDTLLAQLADNIEQRGGRVHWARDAEHARQLITDIARQHDCRLAVKTKSMTTEEIGLTDALTDAGLETYETDMGELILQLDNDHPSHIITPMIHKSRQQVGRLFQQKLGIPYTEEASELIGAARAHLRDKFRRADLGIIGVNFALAETGTLVMLTNEGNGRLTAARPRVCVALMGMEKVIPSPADLAVMLRLVVRSAVGSRLTVYTNMITGPARPGEPDGPEHLHVVVLDNGRSHVLGSPYRDLLACLRCGACLNTCPVYRKIGGHTYGSVYPGPIGISLTPLLQGDHHTTKNMLELCSLCGACLQRCPVNIDIPRLVINQRRDLNSSRGNSRFWRWGLGIWAWWYRTPGRYTFAQRALRRLLWPLARRGWVRRLGSPWTAVRDLPLPAKRLFRDLWKQTGGKP